MTGTACDVCEDNNNSPSGLSNIDLLSAWITGNIDTDCLLIDIDQYGGSLLIPKNKTLPLGTFKLLVMSPDDEIVQTVLVAQLRWTDYAFTTAHSKVGVKFLDIKEDSRHEVNSLMEFFKTFPDQIIKCTLLKKNPH